MHRYLRLIVCSYRKIGENLTSIDNPEEQYVLRVPVCPEFRESDGVCEDIESDAALLDYL